MSPLDRLAPDQRAVVQLVLGQGRSYDQLAELLGISRDAVRARAHAGLAALGPRDAELPGDQLALLADHLLGQGGAGAEPLLAGSPAARAWSEEVAAALAPIRGAGAAAAPSANGAAQPAAAAAPEPAAAGEAQTPRGRERERAPLPSSRLGGAILLGLVVLLVAGGAAWLLTRDDDEPAAGSGAGASAPAGQGSAGQEPIAPAGEIPLRGVDGAPARGVMRIYTQDDQVAFTLQAERVPPNRTGEAYAVWFTAPGRTPRRLGFAEPVTAAGTLGVSGPQASDLQRFPQWLAGYTAVVVSAEGREDADGPGPIVMRGRLPGAG